MKKTYVAPEAEVVALAVEDVTNAMDLESGMTGRDDNDLSLGGALSGLFN